MADTKKSQAQKRATNTSGKKKKPSVVESGNKKPTNSQKERIVPVRFISAAAFFATFVVLLVIFFGPEGALIHALAGFIHGIFGQFAFAVAIPVSLYLFLVHAFSSGQPVKMRTICAGVFVLLCGCLSHLSNDPQNLAPGLAVIGDLYLGGAAGTTGGVLCGLVAMLFQWLCGNVVSFVLFVILAGFMLLASMQITIPSLVKAIKNRPRAEWENEEKAAREAPAERVVNHIANKRIEIIEQKRKRAESAEQLPAGNPEERAAEILSQIESDVEDPVSVAAVPAAQKETIVVSAEPVEIKTEEIIEEIVPEGMPVLEAPISAPVPEEKKETPSSSKKVTAKETQTAAEQIKKEIELAESVDKPAYCFPPIDLLKLPQNTSADGTAEMRENSRRLNETLASFKIEAHIINVTRGPSVTRYEVELEKGVRLSKLTTAADDIALSLGATGVRIAAIPGKISVVGIEVPNKAVTTVSLREVIGSTAFAKAKSMSSFAVGKDIGGNCIVGNIAKLPHMLIAGTTGSGKSVCMNSIIISLLYKASPDDVKLIMVDPKMVELGIYNGIPHLLIPVVTDPKKAAGSLQWAVSEMMRRYKAMSDAGVRDLESYNSIMAAEEETAKKLPQIVVIIDELADLMLVAAKEVEESICRIAQMGRAAGIHLIIATQRPSADVITGLMKANIPSRIAFAVASAMESRIILDTQGAEKLVGRGDMLFAPIGDGKPKRVQGCFVSDSEVEAVASYVKANHLQDYDQQIMAEIEQKAAQTGNKSAPADAESSTAEMDGDEMLPAAVDVILETGQASVSMLQRRLKLGYARAARIVDEMEEKGIVGPFQGSKPRTILVTKEQWEAMKGGAANQLMIADYEPPAESMEELV